MYMVYTTRSYQLFIDVIISNFLFGPFYVTALIYLFILFYVVVYFNIIVW